MAVYLVQLASFTAVRFNSADAQIIVANSSSEAKDIAKATRDGDTDAAWANATVTRLDVGTHSAGWVFALTFDGSTYTLTANSSTTIDSIMALFVGVLIIASYDLTTYVDGVLEIKKTATNIGDKVCTLLVTPPAGVYPSDVSFPTANLVTSIQQAGISTDPIKVTLNKYWDFPGRKSPVTVRT